MVTGARARAHVLQTLLGVQRTQLVPLRDAALLLLLLQDAPTARATTLTPMDIARLARQGRIRPRPQGRRRHALHAQQGRIHSQALGRVIAAAATAPPFPRVQAPPSAHLPLTPARRVRTTTATGVRAPLSA